MINKDETLSQKYSTTEYVVGLLLIIFVASCGLFMVVFSQYKQHKNKTDINRIELPTNAERIVEVLVDGDKLLVVYINTDQKYRIAVIKNNSIIETKELVGEWSVEGFKIKDPEPEPKLTFGR